MRIKTKTSQHRRDFTAIYACEHCGHEVEGSGYDDAYYHQTVIPGMTCQACGKAGTVASSTPDVPAGVVL